MAFDPQPCAGCGKELSEPALVVPTPKGAALDDRPGLGAALGMIRDRQAQGIVVPRLDRLARDLIVQETVLAEIRRLGGEVFSTSPAEASYLTDDPDDPSRKMIRQVLGAVAEYERSMVVLRLQNGRRRKAQNGGYASGAPAFGYEARDRELVESEGEQATLARIAELRDSGASLRTICSTLESEGHRTKRGGTEWLPMTIKRVLDRRIVI